MKERDKQKEIVGKREGERERERDQSPNPSDSVGKNEQTERYKQTRVMRENTNNTTLYRE